MFLKFRNLILFAFFMGFCSCGIFFPRKIEPRAKSCFFDPNVNAIIYRGKNDGIRKIEIQLATELGNHFSNYLNESYAVPLRVIDLTKMDTVLLQKNHVNVKLWVQSPVLEDYDIEIKPSDWNKTQLVYSRYNTR